MRMVINLRFTQRDREKFENWLSENNKRYIDLAEYLKVSRTYINQLFNGLTNCSQKRLKLIEEWCGLEFEVEVE